MLLDYLDLAGDRLEDRFATDVEAVRTGYLIANDKHALAKWRAKARHPAEGSAGLTGADLERAVMAIAAKDPSLVAIRT